jgi:hypothetical protein
MSDFIQHIDRAVFQLVKRPSRILIQIFGSGHPRLQSTGTEKSSRPRESGLRISSKILFSDGAIRYMGRELRSGISSEG